MEETKNNFDIVLLPEMKNINNTQISSENEEKQKIFTIISKEKYGLSRSK